MKNNILMLAMAGLLACPSAFSAESSQQDKKIERDF